jgi:serine phosphatase RsbU (regulator of sigma subunit)
VVLSCSGLSMAFALFKKKVPLPTLESVTVPSLRQAEMSAVYYGQRIGGDFYDFVRVAPHLVLFGLLDVAGRYQENGAILPAVQQIFRTVGRQLFSADDINEAEAMIELSLQLNRGLMEASHGVRSCPAFVGCYNEELGTVCYSNAGHTPALLRDDTGVTQLGATGLPLGLFSHVTHDAPTAAIGPGACMLLVSRGLTECRYNGGEFSIERVQDALASVTISGAEQLCSDILRTLDHSSGKRKGDNDITALSLVRMRTQKAGA